MRATAKDLRFHTKALLDAVSRGETVTITYRGKPHARLVPITERVDVGPDPAFGMWRDHAAFADVDGAIDAMRRARYDAR